MQTGIDSERFCPICRNSCQFFLKGPNGRKDARCPSCGSLERHRLSWLFLAAKTNFFSSVEKNLLHIAPEDCFRAKFKNYATKYVTADLFMKNVMFRMDIIQYPDGTFDIIFCSHVLEHIQNDRKAISEFYRILKNDGYAVILIPISTEKTFEDSSVISPLDRKKLFGQADHVRIV